MPVNYTQKYFGANRPLSRTIDRLSLLRRSQVNFIPIGNGRTIRTSPLLEDTAIGWRERFVEAAIAYITNPLIFSANNLICDELADCRIIIEKKSGDKWKEHEDNPLAHWIGHPNQTMSIKEFIRAYSTHFHTFGCVYAFMFQEGDILPNGKINLETNCFDFIFPARIAEDTVSNAYGINWLYLPIGYDDPLLLNPKCLFVDVIYNPVAHSLGIALPTNPLDSVLKIHRLYMNNIERFFTGGAMPSHLLTRIIDVNKDAQAMSISDEEIEEALQKVYREVGAGGRRQNGWLGLRGDWRATKMGSGLPDLINKELLHLIDVTVGSTYKIPSSLFWAGMDAGGQRANRQQDSIDFYNNKIKPLRERILENLSDFLVPLFIPSGKGRYRISADVSESGLAQYAVTKEFRMYERWWQQGAINRGTFLEWVDATKLADSLPKEKYEEYHTTANEGEGLNSGTGEQPIEGGAGGSGSGGDAQPE